MESSKKSLGQFFTRHPDVHRSMSSLITHTTGRALEPAAGEGHLVAVLETERPNLNIEAVELDSTLTKVCRTRIDHADFFSWSAGREDRYDVIFGNPPYVAWKSVMATTKTAAASTKARYSDKTNLYHLFIDRCVDLLAPGGELILIVPKEWLYATSAAPLRNKLEDKGQITHLVDCGEDKLFSDASVPALLIFRFVRGGQGDLKYFKSLQHHLAGESSQRVLRSNGPRWMLLPPEISSAVSGWGKLSDALDVKVGLVTGLDRAFKLPPGTPMANSCVQPQVTTKKVAELFINANHITAEAKLPPSVRAHLETSKAELISRRIAAFDEGNWWHYGAIRNEKLMASSTPRLYSLVKTRDPNPFFTHPAKHFTGGVLGLFLRQGWADSVDPQDVADLLNSSFYRRIFEGLFLTSANKVAFQPATLADVPFPPDPYVFRLALSIVRTYESGEALETAA